MGAWGVEPFDNDSACDWIWKIEGVVVRALKPALRPMKLEKVCVQKRVRGQRIKSGPNTGRVPLIRVGKAKTVERWSLPGYCQSDALAAVEVVLALPILQRAPFKAERRSVAAAHRCENLAQAARLVLDQLAKDEGFVASWREPAAYLAVLKEKAREVQRVLRAQGRARDAVVARHVQRIKRMSKKARDEMVAEKSSHTLYAPTFRLAFKIADGRELPEPTPCMPRPLSTAMLRAIYA